MENLFPGGRQPELGVEGIGVTSLPDASVLSLQITVD
jgi:hypothetical protein